MNKRLPKLVVVCLTGLLWSLSQPETKASIPCMNGSAKNHSNGSLASCILLFNMSVGINYSPIPCKDGQYIYFDQNGQFISCKLSAWTAIKKQNGQVTECPTDNWISVEIAKSGPIIKCGL